VAEAGRFVGRGAELAALGGALSAARAGSGALVLIAGEPGIGKTALTASFADRARGAGVRVASGSAWEWGGAPPFWPWAQVLRALGRHPGGRGAHPEPADPLLELGQRSGEPGAGARFAVFDAVVERLREEAEKSALLVLLDDLHAADVPSLLLLRFAAEQLRDAPVLVVGTWRTLGASPPAQVADLLTELGRVARVLELTGLSADELAELQSARGTSGAPGDLHERTGGNPLLADALLGERDDDVELPRRARATVERRIAGLSEPARALLAAAAVIGRDVPLALLARVAARPLAEVLDHVHALEAERILIARHGASGGHGFRHGLFREVVYAGLSPAARLSLHRAAGAALEAQHGGEPDVLPELARHFLAIAPDPRGVDHAVAAGEHAMRSTAYEDAASLFERALGALAAGAPDPGRAAAVAVRLGDAQAAAGAIAAARETYRRARAAAIAASDGSALVGAALGFARVAGFGRTDDESVEWLRHALAESPAPPERVRLLAALVDRTWMAAGSRAEESAREAVELARETSDPRLLGEALAAGRISPSPTPPESPSSPSKRSAGASPWP
jgi:predicted ATPase